MAKFYKKSQGDIKITISERGVSMHRGAVNMILENVKDPRYIMIGYEEDSDEILIVPVGEDQENDAFKIGERIEEDKYLSVNSKALVRFFKRNIEGFDELIESKGNDTITAYGEWDENEYCMRAKIDRSDVNEEEN